MGTLHHSTLTWMSRIFSRLPAHSPPWLLSSLYTVRQAAPHFMFGGSEMPLKPSCLPGPLLTLYSVVVGCWLCHSVFRGRTLK